MAPKWLAGAVLTAALTGPAQGQEIEGVRVPLQLTVYDTPLVLNGAGVRWKFFIKAYVGALYLPAPTRAPHAVMTTPGPKCIRLVLLRDVEAASMVDELLIRFRANASDVAYGALRDRIDRLNGVFPDMHAGDIVRLEMSESGITRFWLNEALLAEFNGYDFQTAVLGLWLGDRPADARLKQALLGNGG